MAEHAYILAESQSIIEETTDCKKEKDLLVAQSLLLLSGGTIIYCAEALLANEQHALGKIFQHMLEPIRV